MPRKIFKEPNASRYQMSFFPATLNDVVPRDAPVRVLVDVVNGMDCTALVSKYAGGGAPAYDPRTLLMILFLAYSEGVHSSRQIEQRCARDIYYMFVAERLRPDHQTICRFRRGNEAAIKKLFVESVHRCQKAGLVLLEHVAIDGTKLEANVSSKETYSKTRVDEAIAYTEKCIDQILHEAEVQDAADERKGQLPLPITAESSEPAVRPTPNKEAVVAKLNRRLDRARDSKAQMEQTGGKAACATDLESRVMKTKAGNRPAYNAQAAVDGANQIIVAAVVTQDYNDTQQIAKVLPQVIANTSEAPQCITADCGYSSTETLKFLESAGVAACIAETEQQKDKAEFVYDPDKKELRKPATADSEEIVMIRHGERTKDGKKYIVFRDLKAHAAAMARAAQKKAEKRATGKSVAKGVSAEAKPERCEIWLSLAPEEEMDLRRSMHATMTSDAGKATYSLRQQVVEPVFGHMKTTLNFRRLCLRGSAGASIEFLLACAAHNVKKLARALAAEPILRTRVFA